jgi:predicted nucleic acid-binding protein
MRYFDSGVLLKLYCPEARTPEALGLFGQTSPQPPCTALHQLEMRSAVRQKLGRGEISLDESERILSSMDADLADGIFSQPNVPWPDVFLQAEAFSTAHGAATLCRSLDTLHVALAAVLGVDEFCTFDARQAKMAAAVGLQLTP